MALTRPWYDFRGRRGPFQRGSHGAFSRMERPAAALASTAARAMAGSFLDHFRLSSDRWGNGLRHPQIRDAPLPHLSRCAMPPRQGGCLGMPHERGADSEGAWPPSALALSWPLRGVTHLLPWRLLRRPCALAVERAACPGVGCARSARARCPAAIPTSS